MENRLRDLREDRNLKQSDVSLATGIDQRTISNYETGKTNPDSFALIKLADYYGVSIDYLLSRTNRDLSTHKQIKDSIDDAIRALDDVKKML